MAIDQNSIIPKDLRPLNLNRTAAPPDDPRLLPPRTLQLFIPSVDPAIQSPRSGLLYPNDPNFAPLGFRAAAAMEDRPDSEQPSSSPSSSKKVKFLCSIGGKILPRPSDGALRYVGGQTRIVSVRRDVTFRDLVQKMSDVYGGGGIAIKYQLPGEDLDALVSVSCAEDLENMMEEHEKLSDSDAKLRIFLFTPQSETDPLIPDDDKDVSRRYVEAINGVFERMDSVASTSSVQNSDGPIHVGENLDGFACGRGGDGVTDSRFVFLPPYSVVPAAAPIEAAEVATGSFHPSLGIGAPLYVRPGPYAPIAAHGVKQSAGHHPFHWRAEVQLPPLHPVAVNRCGWHQVAAPVVAETVVRLEDCYMCQKSLPHAHSDTVIQGRHGSASEPQFHSFHSDEAARPWQAHHRVLPVPVLSEGLVERKEEQPLGIDLGKHGFQGAEGGAQLGVPVFSVPAPRHEYRTLTALPLDVQAPYGMYLTTINLPQMCHEHMLHQPPLASTQYQMKPVSVADVNPVRSEASAPESATRDPVTEFIGKHPAFIPREGVPSLAVSHEHIRPINVMMETLHVSPPELNVRPNIDLKQEGLPVVVESGVHLTEPAYTSSAVKIAARDDVREVRSQDDASANPAIVHPPHLSQVGSLHCPLPGDPPQMVYQHFEPLRPEVISGQPVLSCANSAQNTVNLIPVREPNNEVSQFYSRNIHNGLVIPKSSNLPSSLVLSGITSELLGNIQEPASSGTAPLSNGDPWKTLPTTNFQSVKSIKVATSAELLTVENHLAKDCDSGPKVYLEGGGYHLPSNLMNVDTRIEAVQAAEEERIKQELQAVAEGVAVSVLQPSMPPVSAMYTHQVKDPASDINQEKLMNVDEAEAPSVVGPHDNKIEEIKDKPTDKASHGLQITDDIDRLQIIKNSDLEELRELGSGTFGTVYHGKWRGSDVAIKRINDRCFAGKQSEQERLRADFWNEACKLADLHHPNVVAFYGVVLDGPGGSVATVTEYMVNGSLRDALRRNDKILDRRRHLLIAMDVAFGMEYLHGKNIVHFDLKSDNLLVNMRDPQRPICKVGDLGLSKVKCQTLISGGVRGTLPWMAPELLNGSSSLVSEKVDVFSFGIVMWELLTGQEPYADLHYGVIIGGIVSNTLRPPVPESCDPEWRSLMEQCWSAEPSERPNFIEVAARLRSMAAALSNKGQQTLSQVLK